MQAIAAAAKLDVRTGLSVVLPAFDEIDALEPLLLELRDTLGSGCEKDWEVVVVDDGSRDGTRERLEKLAGEWPWLQVVRHTNHRGQSAAICSGVVAAGFEWIATLDADGQNPPAEIPRLTEARDRLGGGALGRRAGEALRRLAPRAADTGRERGARARSATTARTAAVV